MNFENIILDFSYFGIFLLMILNGFISFPSSQLLFIIVGYFVFTGHINPIFAIIVGGVGNAIGNIFLYEVSRKKGLKYILKFKIFPKNQIKKVQIAFNKKGPIFLFIAKLLPALKVFVPIPAGISKMNRVLFFLIVWITSTIWVTIFLLLGYFFGKSYQDFGKFGFILIFVALLVLTLFMKYINSEEIISELNKNKK